MINFDSGFITGYLLVFCSVLIFIIILYFVENSKKKRYLIEINSLNEYEDWKRGGK